MKYSQYIFVHRLILNKKQQYFSREHKRIRNYWLQYSSNVQLYHFCYTIGSEALHNPGMK